MESSVGSRAQGFVVRRIVPVDLLDSRAIELEHESSGLRVLHVQNEDVENLFSITFPTAPRDDTGVPHILEHSVLAGSRKYPAKEGFFGLLQRSLATFINAMTADEHTLYPVSSTVPKDLFNLADVYWDAVFHPLLTEHTFRREGHRLELAVAGDRSSALVVKGIVYSEMQGNYSGAEALAWRAMDQGLFPNSIYGLDAGGDPDAIVNLTYQDFRAFYERHYQPGHAMVVVYGNIATERYLEFIAERLSDSEGRPPPQRPPEHQPRWPEPRTLQIKVPVAPSDRGRSWLALGWICGDGTDPERTMDLALLYALLVGHPGAVLRKAVLDSKIGDDLALTHFSSKRLDSTIHVGVRGAEARRADDFVEVVLSTLRKLVADGIPRDAVETASQQLAYSTLEINDSFPTDLLWKLSTRYVLTGDPFPALKSAEYLRQARLRALDDPGHLSKLITTTLLENPHRLLLVAEGDPDWTRRRDEALTESLRARKASMAPADLDRLVADAAEFERLEASKDDDAFQGFPELAISDLPKRPRSIPSVVERAGRLEFLENQVFANGINYLELDLDLGHLPADLLPYVALFTRCLGKLGTKHRRWAETSAEVAACTSGIRGWTQVDSHAVEASRTLRSFRLQTSFLDGNADRALSAVEDLLFNMEFGDPDRLGEILAEERSQGRAHVAWRAHQLAAHHATRLMSPEGWLSHQVYGVPQIRRVERISDGFTSKNAELMDQTTARLSEVRDALARTLRLTASFTGSSAERDRVERRVRSWANRAPAGSLVPPGAPEDEPFRNAGLAAPMDVAFCYYVVPGPHYADPASPALRVASTHFRHQYILDEVRLRGAAYGAWCTPDMAHRAFQLGSYRDPQIARTLGVFRNAAAAAAQLEWSAREIERAILVTAKDSLRPNRPGEATSTALWWHVHGMTDEVRLARYQALISVSAADARRALIDVLERGAQSASVCVVSSREKLEAANLEVGEGSLNVEDIFGG